jgi:uncharacterized membrane protein
MWKLGIASVLVIATQAHADGVQITDEPHHVTEGRVIIDASADDIYNVVTQYAQWGTVLSDIRSISVESGDREHGRVRFHSRALGHTVTVQFDNERGRAIRFRGVKGPPGGRSNGEYILVPVDSSHTQVTARLYMDVVGAPGIFVREKQVKKMRRAKLQADLSDMAAYFAARR